MRSVFFGIKVSDQADNTKDQGDDEGYASNT